MLLIRHPTRSGLGKFMSPSQLFGQVNPYVPIGQPILKIDVRLAVDIVFIKVVCPQ